MSTTILKVKNLFVKLDNDEIIKNLSFQVKKGDFLTILGPNGSGKTILLKTLLKLISRQTTGTVEWSSDTKIGYLPQGLTQLKLKGLPMSVEEFLLLKKIKKEKIIELLSIVGINDKKILNKKLGTLSGGQFQRILMAWALAKNPNVLLFDEPTTGIDAHGEKTVYDLLHKLQKEQHLTVLLITHDFNIVYKYSTSVLCMSKNKSCQTKPAETLSPKKLEEIYGMPIKFYKHNHH